MPEQALHFTSFMIGFLVFSSLHIVVGEQVPKTLAIREPEPVSQWIAYPLHISYVVLYPLNWLLNESSRKILELLGIRESSHHEILSDVEIEGWSRSRPSTARCRSARPNTSTTSSASASSKCPTSWFTAPKW
jgi:CBS domain containing-hemolysin-like protein